MQTYVCEWTWSRWLWLCWFTKRNMSHQFMNAAEKCIDQKSEKCHSSACQEVFLFCFFWMKRAHHVPPFPRVADTNEPSFITVIKPAGRLFLHVAAPPLNERLSPWAMADFQGALWAALRLHGHRSITKAHWFSLQYLLASIFRVQFNQCVLLLCI